MSFIHEDFLLTNQTAKRLYHTFAENEPILDYHCHLPPQDIAENRQFKNLFEIWLEGDHYKWRAMRANGVDERYCTGDADPRREVSGLGQDRAAHAAQSALSLDTSRAEALLRHRRTARRIECGAASGSGPTRCWRRTTLRAQGILKKFDVKALCTTDDPTDDLSCHKAIAASGLATRVFPAFRPDKALNVHQPDLFNPWVEKLAGGGEREYRRASRISSTRCGSATTSSTRWARASPITA